MACTQTFTGIDLACTGAIGGIKEVYIANWDNVAYTVSSGKISTITMSSSEVAKTYRFRKNTGSMVSTATFNDENGTRYVSTDLNLQFTKLETAKRTEMQALFSGQCAVIVKTQDNTYWFLGADNPVTMTAGTAETGTAMDDLNGYTMTLNDLSMAFPYEVESTAVNSFRGISNTPVE